MSYICGDCHQEHKVPKHEDDEARKISTGNAGLSCVLALVRERDSLVLQIGELRADKQRLIEERGLLVEGTLAIAHDRDEKIRLNERMKIRLEQIVESDDTTRMTGEQILMGYNANKDLARAALTEMQCPEKRNCEWCGGTDSHASMCRNHERFNDSGKTSE